MNDIKQYIDSVDLGQLVDSCNQDSIQSITLTQKSNSFETHPPVNRGCGIGEGEADKLHNKNSKLGLIDQMRFDDEEEFKKKVSIP